MSKSAPSPRETECGYTGSTGSDPAIRKRVQKVASQQFGFDNLRPGQEEAIESVLRGQDTLVVAPTGSGKSAIYQIAGLLMGGTVVVVSPLIALQKDQVDSIQDHGLDDAATVINSTRKASELDHELQKIEDEGRKFVFLAPEQLAKDETLDTLAKANVCLFVVDEAHCVSEWGHDFRPDYIRLGNAIDRLKHPAVLAMTATASQEVRNEIVRRLHMSNANVLVGSFDRPNIYLRVDRFKEAGKKLEGLLHRVRWAEKPGIIYVGTRREAESIMAGLEEEGIGSLFYHGGMKASEREQVQDQFMAGEVGVIVATNAFGMGIDKENVRFVYHFTAPGSLDSYYQEIGRAGRDGRCAEAILFFREQDIGSHAFQTGKAHVDAEAFEKIATALTEANKALTRQQLADETGISARKLSGSLQQMEDAGALRQLKSGGVRLVKQPDIGEAAMEADEQQQRLKERNRERLDQMREYANTCQCRRALLLRYFGEEAPDLCCGCDNCEAKAPEAVVDNKACTRREVA